MVKGKKANLVTKVLVGVGLALGCASCSTEEGAMLGKIFAVGVGTNPHASLDERAIGAMMDAGSQARLDSYNAGRMGTDVYVGNNPQKFYTTEIYNLDTNKKEIEISNIRFINWSFYLLERARADTFPENGYQITKFKDGNLVDVIIVEKRDGKVLNIDYIEFYKKGTDELIVGFPRSQEEYERIRVKGLR